MGTPPFYWWRPIAAYRSICRWGYGRWALLQNAYSFFISDIIIYRTDTFPEALAEGLRRLTFPPAALPCSITGRRLSEVSRFPCETCPHMRWSLTPPEQTATRLSPRSVWPSRQSTSSASGNRCFRSSMQCLRFPLSTLPHPLAEGRGMTRGQCGLLFLHCKTLSFSMFHRLSSALSD